MMKCVVYYIVRDWMLEEADVALAYSVLYCTVLCI